MRLIYESKIKKNQSVRNINYDNANIELVEKYVYNDGYGNRTETARIYVNDVPSCIVEPKDLDILQEIFRELYSIDPDKWVWYNLEERVNEELERKRKIEEKEEEKRRERSLIYGYPKF